MALNFNQRTSATDIFKNFFVVGMGAWIILYWNSICNEVMCLFKNLLVIFIEFISMTRKAKHVNKPNLSILKEPKLLTKITPWFCQRKPGSLFLLSPIVEGHVEGPHAHNFGEVVSLCF